MILRNNKFDFLEYLASGYCNKRIEVERVPPLTKLSESMGVSIASLREQLGVARAFGFIDVRPRTGIRRLPYSFAPAVHTSLSYAISLDRGYFDDFSDLRRHLEANYWFEAVERLTEDDKEFLHNLVDSAWRKLEDQPIQLPHIEHRELHLIIFGRLENPFVKGILEAYWDAYEEVGLSRYTELEYLKNVWNYHREIVDAICSGDDVKGHQMLMDHMKMIRRLNQN
jgi:DNA-binding FadR family transcriptional regulator